MEEEDISSNALVVPLPELHAVMTAFLSVPERVMLGMCSRSHRDLAFAEMKKKLDKRVLMQQVLSSGSPVLFDYFYKEASALNWSPHWSRTFLDDLAISVSSGSVGFDSIFEWEISGNLVAFISRLNRRWCYGGTPLVVFGVLWKSAGSSPNTAVVDLLNAKRILSHTFELDRSIYLVWLQGISSADNVAQLKLAMDHPGAHHFVVNSMTRGPYFLARLISYGAINCLLFLRTIDTPVAALILNADLEHTNCGVTPETPNMPRVLDFLCQEGYNRLTTAWIEDLWNSSNIEAMRWLWTNQRVTTGNIDQIMQPLPADHLCSGDYFNPHGDGGSFLEWFSFMWPLVSVFPLENVYLLYGCLQDAWKRMIFEDAYYTSRSNYITQIWDLVNKNLRHINTIIEDDANCISKEHMSITFEGITLLPSNERDKVADHIFRHLPPDSEALFTAKQLEELKRRSNSFHSID